MKNSTATYPAKRRRHGNRHATCYRSPNRAGTSSGQPVHISFYLRPALDKNGKPDRVKIIELFNTGNYA